MLVQPPGALGRGQKVKYHLISITKSISIIFIPNFVCVLTNERYKTYQTGVFFCSLCHALGLDMGVLRGQNQIPPCCLSVMLSPSKPLDEFNRIWCVSNSHEWGAQRHFFWPHALGLRGGGGQKVKYHLISISKSISKIFIPNFMCALTNERYKTYQTGFLLCSLGHAQGVGLWGVGGAKMVKKSNFQTWSCGISNRRR